MVIKTEQSHLTPPEETIKGRYILLAVIAHILLFVALGLNVTWKSETPPPAQAELWTLAELEAIESRPLTQPQKPEEQPQTPELTPPKQEEPKPIEEDPSVANAEIALEELRRQEAEAEKRRLAEEERLRQQALEEKRLEETRLEQERLDRERKAEAEQKIRLEAEEKVRQEAEQKAQAERKAEEERKLAAERKAQEQKAEEERLRLAVQQQAEAEAEAKRKAEAERKAAEEKAKQEAAEAEAKRERERQAAERRRQQEARDAAERERIRQEQLAHIQGMAGGEGSSNTGSTNQAGGTGTNTHLAYRNRLAGIVERRINYTGDRSGNLSTGIYVETDNNGKIITVRITRSSGNRSWDDAAERGIWQTEVFPPDVDGKRPDTKFNFNLSPQK